MDATSAPRVVLDPDSFAQRWLDKQRQSQPESPLTPLISDGDATLPADAAPFLSFKQFSRKPRIWELYGPMSSWTDEDRQRLAPFRVIGSDGEGNPLCLLEDRSVCWLDHEARFRARKFVNSSVPLLAECLLAYLCKGDTLALKAQIASIDPAAIAPGTFWSGEIQTLLAKS